MGQEDIIVFGTLMGIAGVILFKLYLDTSLVKAQTVVFTSLVLFEVLRLQTIRSEYKLGIFSNKPLFWAVILSLILHLMTIYTPATKWFKTTALSLVDWGVLLVACFFVYVAYWLIERYFLRKRT